MLTFSVGIVKLSLHRRDKASRKASKILEDERVVALNTRKLKIIYIGRKERSVRLRGNQLKISYT